MSTGFTLERSGEGRVRLAGRLGFDEAPAAFRRTGELLDGSAAELEVDAGALREVDSATLAVLLSWAADAARRGIRLRVSSAPGGLRALAQLCGAEALLGI